jgi:hypothetical protein
MFDRRESGSNRAAEKPEAPANPVPNHRVFLAMDVYDPSVRLRRKPPPATKTIAETMSVKVDGSGTDSTVRLPP